MTPSPRIISPRCDKQRPRREQRQGGIASMPLMAGQRPSSSRRKAPKLVAVPSPNGDTTSKRGGRRADPDAAAAQARGRGTDVHDQADDQGDDRADTDPRLGPLASGLDDPRLSDVD